MRGQSGGGALVCACVWFFACDALGASAGDTPDPATGAETPVAIKFDGPQDATRVAREVVGTFMKDEEWKKQVAELRKKYENWAQDHDGDDMGRFLNDQLVSVGLAALNGNIEKLKKLALWVAFYHEFKQPLHSLALEFGKENKDSLACFFQTFTWERAHVYVKNSQWKKDREAARAANSKSAGCEAKPAPKEAGTNGE